MEIPMTEFHLSELGGSPADFKFPKIFKHNETRYSLLVYKSEDYWLRGFKGRTVWSGKYYTSAITAETDWKDLVKITTKLLT